MSFRLSVVLIVAVLGGTALAAKRGEVELRVIDAKTREPIAVRMHLKDQKGKIVKPPKTAFWHDHFVLDGALKLELPPGNYSFTIERGLEYKDLSGYFQIEDKASDVKELTLERFITMADDGWYSGDLFLQRPATEIEALMRADDLHIAPLIGWSTKQAAKTEDATPTKFDGNRFFQLLGGYDDRDTAGLLYFDLRKPLDLTAATKEFPASIHYLDRAKESACYTVAQRATCWDLPVWIATNQLDAVSIAHADMLREGALAKESPGKKRDTLLYPPPHGVGRWSQDVYYELLNAGIRISPAAGSGSDLVGNPAGYNRVYVHCEGELTWEKWFEGLQAGKVVVTNGPVMQPRANGELPGHVFTATAGETVELSVSLNLSTRERIEYLELVHNGKVVHEVRLDKWAEANGVLPPVKFSESGWLLVRAVTNNAKTYRYATSGPFYIEIGGKPRISKKSAQFFFDWTFERARQIKLSDPAQQDEVISHHRTARDFWQSRLDAANAE